MKLFYTKHEEENLLFVKAEDAATARAAYLNGYSEADRADREADVLTEVDCLETLIDLMPDEFEANEDI